VKFRRARTEDLPGIIALLAQRFYDRLGFEASHVGYKLKL
jgi:predicted N-acetyltransferase YhbS